MFDWVTDFIEWIYDLVKAIFSAIWNLLLDAAIFIVSEVLEAIVWLVNSIPVPDFIQGGLGEYLSAISPDVLYFLSATGFNEAIALMGAGVSFRLVRKMVTLGQW